MYKLNVCVPVTTINNPYRLCDNTKQTAALLPRQSKSDQPPLANRNSYFMCLFEYQLPEYQEPERLTWRARQGAVTHSHQTHDEIHKCCIDMDPGWTIYFDRAVLPEPAN